MPSPGFELRYSEPKAAMLPLRYTPLNVPVLIITEQSYKLSNSFNNLRQFENLNESIPFTLMQSVEKEYEINSN